MLYSEIDSQPIYSTADIKSIYGLSTNGLFYYEDKGIITPQRVPENQYRIFKMEECSRLYRAKQLNSFGFEIKQCAEMLNYVDGDTLYNKLTHKREEILRKIHFQNINIQVIDNMNKLIELIQQNNIPFTLTENPTMFRVAIKREDTTKGSVCINKEDYKNWCDMIPLINASILIHKDSLEPNKKFLYSLGFITSEEIAKYYKIKVNNYTAIIPKQKCIYTIIAGHDAELFDTNRFHSVITKIKQQGYKLVGDPFTKMIVTFDVGNGMLRYDEAWFPVA